MGRCNQLNLTHGILMVVQQLGVGCTLILRVYAMYNCDKRLLSFFVLVSLVTVGLGGWSIMPSGPTPTVHTTLIGCHIPQSRTQSIRMAAAWEAELVCNTMVLGFTMYRAVRQTGTIILAGSLWHVMILDGESLSPGPFPLYPFDALLPVICLANVANILMFYFGDMITSSDLAGLTSTSVPVFSVRAGR
ncbi:hypothetical protein B0H19DRAFT_1257492 [Mycena capillaripes]|nr:hypothetical protein B0H19DRAFT_1257492 [Mycena capillaripes]